MPTYADTVPVMERHRFDVASLDRYFREKLEGYRGGLEVRQFDSGHSNPTFFVAADMAEGRRDFVLRKKPPGQLVTSAHQVDREYRVISALAATDVPVAPARLLCSDDAVIGQMFYVMEAVPGRILTNRLRSIEGSLSHLLAHPHLRARGQTFARLGIRSRRSPENNPSAEADNRPASTAGKKTGREG